jgi:ornithine decarboxylase
MMQMAKFRKNLPGVQPYYAVKCNPSQPILDMLSALGASFDCASSEEFLTVLNSGVGGVDQVIFANPHKRPVDMRKARDAGVQFCTFDSETELEKLSVHWPAAKCVLRIRTEDAAAVCSFSTKFGAPMAYVPALLTKAKALGMEVVGVSFHVGSGNSDPNAYIGSIKNARKVFDMAGDMGFTMTLLDLGGGFPGVEPRLGPDGQPSELSFEEICAHVRPHLSTLFPHTRVIAEPGRYFAASTHALAVNVFSKRLVPLNIGAHSAGEGSGFELDPATCEHQYYMNDGLYQSFNCIVFDYAHPELHLLKPKPFAPIRSSTIFGPTCDSLDCVLRRQQFPELELEDWLFVPNFGAYTSAAGSKFNGFSTTKYHFVCTVSCDEVQP